MKTCFVSGIDTDAGKTVATGMAARWLRAHGVNAITLKLVQTGNTGMSEDIVKHREIMGTGLLPEDRSFLTAPQIFTFPASPHLAEMVDKRPLDLKKILDSVHELEKRFDLVLVEGAGGLAVPLTEDLLTVDFASERKWPVLLVTSGKLGSINHTVMSMEMLANRKMTLAGTVYNWCASADPLIDSDTPRILGKYLRRYKLNDAIVKLPRVSAPWEAEVDFSAVFGGGK